MDITLCMLGVVVKGHIVKVEVMWTVEGMRVEEENYNTLLTS